jgi:hypothetical protein
MRIDAMGRLLVAFVFTGCAVARAAERDRFDRIGPESSVQFDDGNLIEIIRLVHGARVRTAPAATHGR